MERKLLEIERFVAHRGCDWVYCWVRPMLMMSGERVRLMPSLLEIAHPDCFSEQALLCSEDGGGNWSELLVVEGLRGYSEKGRRIQYNLSRVEPLGNGKFLGIGQTIAYGVNGDILDEFSSPFSCIYDFERNRWSDPECFSIDFGKPCSIASDPQIVREGEDFLIPFYVHFPDERQGEYNAFALSFHSAVVRCRVADSGTVTACEISDLLSLDIPRGFCESALCKFRGRYYMTLRNDESGYIVRSSDWRKWPVPEKLRFDDGSWLGNYNTMTKLVELDGRLYLIYTRKGLNNDHVFRHRAPLLIGELDPETLQVIRETEQILVPEYGARLGNFTVTKTAENTAGLAVAEWAEPGSQEREHGADNRIWFVTVKA